MVAAGVYMLARRVSLPDRGLSSRRSSVIAWIGTITAALAALMATQQDDIKRILAYSTLSQLGYMVMAVGLASRRMAALRCSTFSLTLFFKALLFLGAGAVIHALHHEQDIWRMGGLSKFADEVSRLPHLCHRHARAHGLSGTSVGILSQRT